ncbi:HIT family protein [Roseateles sp. BYS180W]|uniref:HIT family protein n=1 Tax=Roseateles rivi TaxID=3299028 RepID=A0ABW7FXJ3_9BURK
MTTPAFTPFSPAPAGPDAAAPCVLCAEPGGLLLLQRPLWRVVRVTDTPAYPAFYRVIWNAHVGEFSELPRAQRQQCMEVVCAVEQVLRRALCPTKINLASLGNVVPHLHWHVIARFEGDAHFPQPIWATAQREAAPVLPLTLPELDALLLEALKTLD